jgi:SPP1 family predicted phage head-tail adaptor
MSLAMAERGPALGEPRERVQLKQRVTTDEDEGGETALYVPLATVWARVRTLSARPATAADGRAVALTHSVVLRYRSDIGPGDRIVHAGRSLEVLAASDLNGRHAWLSLTCSETASRG